MISKIKLCLTIILVFAGLFSLSATVWADDSRIDFSLTFTNNSTPILGVAYKNIGLEIGDGSVKNPYETVVDTVAFDTQGYSFIKDVPIFFKNGLDILIFFDLADQSKLYFGIGCYDIYYRSIVRDSQNVLYISDQLRNNLEYVYSLGTKLYLNKRVGLSFGYHTLLGYNGSFVFSLY